MASEQEFVVVAVVIVSVKRLKRNSLAYFVWIRMLAFTWRIRNAEQRLIASDAAVSSY